jgi:phospholipase/lecithinase/hemolysin
MGSLSFALAVLASSLLLLPLVAGALTTSIKATFVFGDDHFTNGENNYKTNCSRANFFPYGIAFTGRVATGRTCDGKILPDLICDALGLAYAPPYLSNKDKTHGINFASQGAGLLTTTGDVSLVGEIATEIALGAQVAQFADARVKFSAKLLESQSLFMISIGTFDVAYFFTSGLYLKVSTVDYVADLIATLETNIKLLHTYGARKFLILNVPPVGSCPFSLTTCANDAELAFLCASENALAEALNAAVKTLLDALALVLTDFEFTLFDDYALVAKVVAAPTKFGFEATEVACCGHGTNRAEENSCGATCGFTVCSAWEKVFFWDHLHLSSAAQKLEFDYLWAGSGYTYPRNLKKLCLL